MHEVRQSHHSVLNVMSNCDDVAGEGAPRLAEEAARREVRAPPWNRGLRGLRSSVGAEERGI